MGSLEPGRPSTHIYMNEQITVVLCGIFQDRGGDFPGLESKRESCLPTVQGAPGWHPKPGVLISRWHHPELLSLKLAQC